MQMQFEKKPVSYLNKVVGQICSLEQTLELRLPDGMPDIGRVLGAWGQVILRGKEWNADTMTVSAGATVWVLYAPENGEEVRSVEGWIPFSMKWELPEGGPDGKILVSPLLRGVDARCISSRKLMLRATLDMLGEGWVNEEKDLPTPLDVPDDISLLEKVYPLRLVKEAGEKSFFLEDHRSISSTLPKPDKILYYVLQPEILEKKVMAGKVVFRGVGCLHLVYRGENGTLCTWDYDLPFSQYADLQGSYDQDAMLVVQPCVTSLDVSLNENSEVEIKCGLVGQFILSDRTMISVAEDAYSPYRVVNPVSEDLKFPAILEQFGQNVRGELSTQTDVQQIVDVSFYLGYVASESCDGGICVPLTGCFQILYYDPDGELRSSMSNWEYEWKVTADENSKTYVTIQPSGKPQAMQGAGSVVLRGDIQVSVMTIAGQGIPALTGLEMEEEKHIDRTKPNLIVCRKGENRLWDIAKRNGSTVEAILQANELQEEPECDRVLLVPIV